MFAVAAAFQTITLLVVLLCSFAQNAVRGLNMAVDCVSMHCCSAGNSYIPTSCVHIPRPLQAAWQAEEHRAKEAQRQAEEAARALSVMMHGSPRQSHAVDFAAAIDQSQAALQSQPVKGELTKWHAHHVGG